MVAGLRQLLRFIRRETGAVFAEAAFVLPVIVLLAAGIVEFGTVFWQRHQLQTGVRDAARYWSRCPPDGFGAGCSEEIAENIAFYGTPNPGNDTPPRVPGWSQPTQLTIDPLTRPENTAVTVTFTVKGEVEYQGSPIFGLLFRFRDSGAPIPTITLSHTHEARYLGW